MLHSFMFVHVLFVHVSFMFRSCFVHVSFMFRSTFVHDSDLDSDLEEINNFDEDE